MTVVAITGECDCDECRAERAHTVVRHPASLRGQAERRRADTLRDAYEQGVLEPGDTWLDWVEPNPRYL